MASKKVYYKQFDIQGSPIPFEIHEGGFPRMRVSMTKETIKISLSNYATLPMKQKFIQWSIDWVAQKFEKEPNLKLRYIPKVYNSGDYLQVGERKYLLQIIETEDSVFKGSLRLGTITLTLFQNADPRERNKAIKTILSRLVAKDFLPYITQKVTEINAQYFKKEISLDSTLIAINTIYPIKATNTEKVSLTNKVLPYHNRYILKTVNYKYQNSRKELK